MVSRVTITNFKSVEHADFEARRVNVFIGEPNSGKSNLLEAVGICSDEAIKELGQAFRLEQVADLYVDHEANRQIQISLSPGFEFRLKWSESKFDALLKKHGTEGDQMLDYSISPNTQVITSGFGPVFSGTKFYRYRDLSKKEWRNAAVPELLPPFGANLPSLLSVDRELRTSISELFLSKGYRLEIRPSENRLFMTAERDGVLFSFPFEVISETMKRIVFYKAVLESNKDSVLVLDEPEANTFPFYTKYLAERIALDTSNQFFLSTHNPYVLMSIIEKTPQTELAIYVTRMRNYRTEVRLLSPDDCVEALDLGMDLFFNLDRYFPE